MYERYAKIRDELGLRDSDVCKRAGISPGTMSDWKRGRYQLKAEKLQKIADALGTTVDMIMGGSEYYYNADTAAVAQQIFENKDMRILFDAAKDSKPEDLRRAADLLMRFKETNPDG
ncbi:MAG TPA: XRE family transcriptional regulator [Lachnospiraceae bacterium]|jgi:transcriptional regulator with XRE-family HTH domain|nr:XRE family transcriptional regulator [Lachnospiraceae bacterium]